jgi:hypothetical protein
LCPRPSGVQEGHILEWNNQNLNELFDSRANDQIRFTVKDALTEEVREVKDVTGNITKSYELFRDQPFDYLFTAEYIPREIKAELRQEAVAQGIIRGGAADFQQPSRSTNSTTEKSTYQ